MRELDTSQTTRAPATGPELSMRFVGEVLARLSECRVRYCVLRNYASFREGSAGTDLDLLVNPEDLGAAFRILGEVAPRHGGMFISRYRAEALITSFCGRNSGSWWGVQIDVFPGLTYRGVPFYDGRDLLRRAQVLDGVPVAPQGEAGMVALLKELLANGSSRKDYDRQAAAEYAASPALYDHCLRAPFGPGASAAFGRYLAHLDDRTLMRLAARRLRGALRWRAFCRHPLRVPTTKVVGLGRRFTRLFRPPGIMLAIVGADDVRRGALIAKIKPVLEAAVHGHVQVRHLGPGPRPDVDACPRGRDPARPTPASLPPGLLRGLRAFSRTACTALNHCRHYWTTVYPSLVKRPCIWIFDCHLEDCLLARFHKTAFPLGWLARSLAVALPKPDTVIFLDTPPDRLGRDARRVVCLDANGTLDDLADRTLSAVAERASARYRKGGL